MSGRGKEANLIPCRKASSASWLCWGVSGKLLLCKQGCPLPRTASGSTAGDWEDTLALGEASASAATATAAGMAAAIPVLIFCRFSHSLTRNGRSNTSFHALRQWRC